MIYLERSFNFLHFLFFYWSQYSLCKCLKISMQVYGCLFFQFCIASKVPKETLKFLHTPYRENIELHARSKHRQSRSSTAKWMWRSGEKGIIELFQSVWQGNACQEYLNLLGFDVSLPRQVILYPQDAVPFRPAWVPYSISYFGNETVASFPPNLVC